MPSGRKGKFFVFYKILILVGILLICFCIDNPSVSKTTVLQSIEEEETLNFVQNIFKIRNAAVLKGDLNTIRELYDLDKRNGLWAFTYQTKKVNYLHSWAEKQGIEFTDIASKIKIKWFKVNDQIATINFLASTTYKYVYKDQPEMENHMRIGTYHEMKIAKEDEHWLITREWYTDPFADSLNLEKFNIEENKALILSMETRDFSTLDERRKGAVIYADLYCGAADSGENSYQYNTKYKNYNALGGDCTNFASQVLYEGGKFKKDNAWNYVKDGSRAWLKATGFKDYMLYSGRGSLIAYGSYDKILKASYKLLPGDLVAYEKKGKVAHTAVVTGADSRGYSLVNSHNTDRYRVPWDLGWSDSGIRFYLIRVNY